MDQSKDEQVDVTQSTDITTDKKLSKKQRQKQNRKNKLAEEQKRKEEEENEIDEFLQNLNEAPVETPAKVEKKKEEEKPQQKEVEVLKKKNPEQPKKDENEVLKKEKKKEENEVLKKEKKKEENEVLKKDKKREENEVLKKEKKKEVQESNKNGEEKQKKEKKVSAEEPAPVENKNTKKKKENKEVKKEVTEAEKAEKNKKRKMKKNGSVGAENNGQNEEEKQKILKQMEEDDIKQQIQEALKKMEGQMKSPTQMNDQAKIEKMKKKLKEKKELLAKKMQEQEKIQAEQQKIKERIEKEELAKIGKKQEEKKEGEETKEIVLDEIDQRWEIISLIGQGTYGAVYKAFDKKLNCMVALKKTKFLRIGEGMPGYAIKEINILKQLNHPSVVKLIDVVNDGLKGEKLYLVFEYCNMDINHHLNSQKKILSKKGLVRLFWQVLQGMNHMHSRRIIHRDLKPSNILITEDESVVKIADLGMARSITVPLKTYTHCVGTLWYRAPEICMGTKVYGPAMDVWALGCILFEFGQRRPLFQAKSEIQLLFKIFRVFGTPTDQVWQDFTQMPEFQVEFPKFRVNGNENLRALCKYFADDEDYIDLMTQMLHLEPSKRISVKGALEHRFFSYYHEKSRQKKLLKEAQKEESMIQQKIHQKIEELENEQPLQEIKNDENIEEKQYLLLQKEQFKPFDAKQVVDQFKVDSEKRKANPTKRPQFYFQLPKRKKRENKENEAAAKKENKENEVAVKKENVKETKAEKEPEQKETVPEIPENTNIQIPV